MNEPCPPRLAQALLSLILARRDREHALGDLAEEHRALARSHGPRAADRWYWSQLWRALAPSVRRRSVSPARALADLFQEGALAARSLGRRPALTVASVLTLGLGIGAATAIFSVTEAVLLRPLPYTAADRLVQVWNTYDSWRGHEVLDAYWDHIALSWPEYLDWRDAQSSFEAVAVYGASPRTLTGRGEPDEVPVGLASASLFPLLGVEPVLGRSFAAADEGAGRAHVALLSHATWQSRFGADPAAIGQTIALSGVPYTVVGVLPRGFHLRAIGIPGMEPQPVWVPVGGLGESLDRGSHSYEALGRLAVGTSLEAAHDEAARILRGDAPPEQRGARLTPRKTEETGAATGPLLLLLAAVALLLLIACGNFATLLVAETSRRGRELATRTALGAGSARILRTLAVESALLGVGGGLVGLGVALGGVPAILELAPSELAVPERVGLDSVVLAFGVGLGLVTGLGFGLFPGLAALRRDPGEALRGTSGHESRAGRRLQRFVLAGQLALSLVLLAGALLLVRTSGALAAVQPGFDARDVWSARASISSTSHDRDEALAAYHEIVERLAASPGVSGASLVSAMPFSGRGGSSSFQIAGREVPDDQKQPEALRRTVLPGYHELIGIPLLAGRHLDPADRDFSAPVTVISASMAERFWPSGDAVGARIVRDRRSFEIVGVVADVLHADLSAPAQPTFYVPFDVAEVPWEMTALVRSELPAAEAAALLRRAVWAVDPDVPVEELSSAAALVARSTRDERFRSALLAAFATAATLLCATGLFGATTRIVSARRRELGIRLALGARRAGLVGRVLREEAAALSWGLAAGLAGALLLAGLLRGFLFGVQARDPLSLGGAVALLAATALAAILLAARRGATLDPVEALRAD